MAAEGLVRKNDERRGSERTSPIFFGEMSFLRTFSRREGKRTFPPALSPP